MTTAEWVAAYAAAFFAVFPLAIFSSRLVWHTGLLPLFTILFMRALFAVIAALRGRARRRRAAPGRG